MESRIKTLENIVNLEILKFEKLRAKLFGFLTLLLLTVFIVLILFFNEIFISSGISLEPFYYMLALFIFFVGREFNIVRILNKLIDKNRFVPESIRYASVFFESSFPTVLLVILFLFIPSIHILSTPPVLLYLIVIILATLSLDFKFPLVAGIIGAVEYFVFTLYVLASVETIDPVLMILYEPLMYSGKSILILAGGVIAGFGANYLKRSIVKINESMIERDRIVSLFGQQVSQEIVDELLSNETEIESQRKFVCVMFLDIRNFTPFAEQHKPEEIIKFQNEFLGMLMELVIKQNGVINQLLGDGFMATFGVPVSKGNDCQNAFDAAVEIIESVEREKSKFDFPNLKVGIGLHAGDVVAGNVGTSARKQYSITGNTVIISARIESLNKEYNSQLLISKEVLENIDSTEINFESLGKVEVKGREEPVDLYKIL